MPEIVALLQAIAPVVCPTVLKQMSQVIYGALISNGRLTRLEISRWTESGNKLVVQARLKGAGMHWAEEHVNPMQALRNILCSGRWQEDWPKIEARLRKQTRQRRRTLHQAHHPAPPTSLVARALQGDFGKPFPEQPAQEPHLPKKNPWRTFKHGKALYQPASPKI